MINQVSLVRNTAFGASMARVSPFPEGDCPNSQTFLSENRESAFGLVYGYGVFQSREDFSDSLEGRDLG